MREVSIPQNLVELVQRPFQEITPENIDIKDTWFTPDIKYNSNEVPNKKLLVSQQSTNPPPPP